MMAQMDAFRRKRNLAAYEGDDSVSDRDLSELMAILDELKPRLLQWLRKQHPELM